MTLPNRAICQDRLALIFPEQMPLRGRLANQLAASAVFVFLYVDSIEGERKLRPTMVLWMCDEAAARTNSNEREAWYAAALQGKRQLAELLETWGIAHRPWYADNTREPLRDETFRAWAAYGAAIRDETIPTTSPRPQWSLGRDFAALFAPDLAGDALAERVSEWQEDHLGTVGLARIAVATQLAAPGSQVVVTLPGGATRNLAPGASSLILKGVIEQLAPRLLAQPAVLLVSESREHVDVVDGRLLDRLGVRVDVARLLPDALLFDAGPGTFWFVEVVFTSGAIDEERRRALASWAESQNIDPETCRYLTAFVGRTAPAFRRLASSVAWGTYVWFLDEPGQIMRMESLPAIDSDASS